MNVVFCFIFSFVCTVQVNDDSTFDCGKHSLTVSTVCPSQQLLMRKFSVAMEVSVCLLTCRVILWCVTNGCCPYSGHRISRASLKFDDICIVFISSCKSSEKFGLGLHLVCLHITPLLRELHWLKVPERIQFRLCVLAYRCLTGTAPSYLTETLSSTANVGSRRRLRSPSTSTLVIPTT